MGRVRNKGVEEYTIDTDKRSTLYREYLRIIAEHQPSIFVMENVKGMLSATVQNQKVFQRILADLQAPPAAVTTKGQPLKYRVLSIVAPARPRHDGVLLPTDFVVACEKYGVPQQRHRVILVGIRDDLEDVELLRLDRSAAPTVRQTIGALPRLRSGLSRYHDGEKYRPLKDNTQLWLDTIRNWTLPDGEESPWLHGLAHESALHDRIVAIVQKLKVPRAGRGGEYIPLKQAPTTAAALQEWLVDSRLQGVCNHESRVHMDSDLARYLFAACYAQVFQVSPKLNQFPTDLQPNDVVLNNFPICRISRRATEAQIRQSPKLCVFAALRETHLARSSKLREVIRESHNLILKIVSRRAAEAQRGQSLQRLRSFAGRKTTNRELILDHILITRTRKMKNRFSTIGSAYKLQDQQRRRSHPTCPKTATTSSTTIRLSAGV